MKLLFILLLSLVTFSNCKLIKRTYYGGSTCDGKLSRVDIMSLCSYKHLISVEMNKITYHERNTSQPYNCDPTSFDSVGVVIPAQECKPFGPESSYKDSVMDGSTLETAFADVPEGTCNDLVYVDTECNNNFIMTSFMNASCYPSYVEEYNMTIYLKNICDKNTFNTTSHYKKDCSDTPITVGQSPYQKSSCQKALSGTGGLLTEVYHSYSFKPITGKPSKHNEVDAMDPNNALKVIPSIILIVSVLLSLFL